MKDVVSALAAVEPAPAERVRQLGARRLDVRRRALIEQAGIEPERLIAGEAPPPAAAGDGRVEFELR